MPSRSRYPLVCGRTRMYTHCRYISEEVRTMHVSIQKWGNSLALRIPRAIAQDLSLGQGVMVDMKLNKKTLTLTPLSKRRESLKTLLSRITKHNLHKEIGTGKPVGREVW